MRGRTPVPVLDRIAAKTVYDPATGCLNWTGYQTRDGYGRVAVGSQTDGTRQMVLVHRVAWLTLVGPIPEGRELDHFKCDNPACWNICHLRPVTHRENVLRGTASSPHCACGEPYDDANCRGDRRHRACYLAQKRTYDAQRRTQERGSHEGVEVVCAGR